MKSTNRPEQLNVNKPLQLCFEFCDTKHLPNSKNDVGLVIDALKAFSNQQILKSRGHHCLDESGKSDYVKSLFSKTKEKLESIDVGHRNGRQGDKRLIYYRDSVTNVAKILTVFCDDHKKK